jgi:hypothetical protein
LSYQSEVLADSPVAYWRFQESAPDYVDLVGGELLSVVTGAPDPGSIPGLIASDSASKALFFDGTDNNGLFNSTLAPDFTNQEVSIEFWIRPDALDGFEIGPGDSYFAFRFESGGLASIGTRFSGSRFQTSAFVAGAKHHVVYTRDASGDANLYINGAFVANANHPDGIFSSELFINFGSFSGTNPANGAFTEFAIYNTVLPQSRVVVHYQAAGTSSGTGVSYRELVLSHNPIVFYEHNETDGATVAHDDSGHDNHGAYSGNFEFEQPGIIADGKSSIFSNGGYVNIPINPIKSLTEFTLEVWISSMTDSADQRIIDFNNGEIGTPTAKYFYVSWNYQNLGGLAIETSFSGPSTRESATTTRLNPSLKYHVVATYRYDSSAGRYSIRLFVNGVSAATSLVSFTPSQIMPALLNAWVAKSPLGGLTNYIGRFDETAIYNRALTDAEILAHYQAGITPFVPTTNIKRQDVADSLNITQSVQFLKEPAGAGRTFNMSLGDTLNLTEGQGGPLDRQNLKDTLALTESMTHAEQPVRRSNKDSLVFVEALHASPFKIPLKDILQITEKIKHNLFKFNLVDALQIIDSVNPHRTQNFLSDFLIFNQNVIGQNNHQYANDVIDLFEVVGLDRFVTNFIWKDTLIFNETPTLHWHVANFNIVDTLTFTELASKTYNLVFQDTLLLLQNVEHVFPENFIDTLLFSEVLTARDSKELRDTLTLIEIMCIQSLLTRSLLDSLVLHQAVAFRINGPDDGRNGGGGGGGGGIILVTTYHRNLFEKIRITELVISDPAPLNRECVVEVN